MKVLLSITMLFSLFLAGCGEGPVANDGPDTAEEEMSEEEVAAEQELENAGANETGEEGI